MSDEYMQTWVRDTLSGLARFQFTPEGIAALKAAPIRFMAVRECAATRGAAIVIPTDIASPLHPGEPWDVPFGASSLRLWNRVPPPGDGWSAHPASRPAWWRHESGTLLPAWDLWGNLTGALTFREEREIPTRDGHGRFAAAFSPRDRAGLTAVPIANDANAALLDAAIAIQELSPPRLALPARLLQPPGVALSHDCDLLRGNDAVTQGIRVARIGTTLARGQVHRAARHARAVLSNVLRPRAFFSGNLRGMIALERQFGFRSVAYFLTGRGGRFGARSGDRAAIAEARALPEEWEAGVHYNYWTVGADAALQREIALISAARQSRVSAGRAHYLRFDSVTGPEFLERNGIRYDESIGWADRLGYRAGIAGPFRPWDAARRAPFRLVEMPLACMESTLLERGGPAAFDALFQHLRSIGGIVSVLFHPGQFHNPEFPGYRGLYESVLSRVYSTKGRSWTPSEVLAEISRSD
jgi:hypothetical protein